MVQGNLPVAVPRMNELKVCVRSIASDIVDEIAAACGAGCLARERATGDRSVTCSAVE
jgi:hypothetical protein